MKIKQQGKYVVKVGKHVGKQVSKQEENSLVKQLGKQASQYVKNKLPYECDQVCKVFMSVG